MARIAALAEIREPDPALVREFAERSFTHAKSDGFVTATVGGTGELQGLEIMVSAIRGEARERLGDRVTEAVNSALDEWARARNEQFGLGGDAVQALTAKADAFARRMDRVAGELEGLRRSLSGNLAEVQQLYRPRGSEPAERPPA